MQLAEQGQKIVSKIEEESSKIESEKLAAIGQRNKLSATKESKVVEERELKQKILEKQEILERCAIPILTALLTEYSND